MTSILLDEEHIYLDSDAATLRNGVFTFEISPPMKSNSHLEKTYMYLKQFSALNNLFCVKKQQFTIRRHRLTTGFNVVHDADFNFNCTDKNFNTVQELCTYLNGKTYPKHPDGTESNYILDVHDEDYGEGLTEVPKLEFLYDAYSGVVKVDRKDTLGTRYYEFVGDIFFGTLNFPEEISFNSQSVYEQISFYVSTKAVNLYRGLHNVYLTCDKVYNSNMNSAGDVPNRLNKIVIKSNFGEYIQWTAKRPVLKYELSGSNLNQLKFQLIDDDGNVWEPNRFFLTLVVELHKPVMHHPNYWLANPSTSLIVEHDRSRHPPIKYLKPNEGCPEIHVR